MNKKNSLRIPLSIKISIEVDLKSASLTPAYWVTGILLIAWLAQDLPPQFLLAARLVKLLLLE